MDVNGVSQDPNNPKNLLVTRDNGEVGSIPKNTVSLLGADPAKRAEVISLDAWRKAQAVAKDQEARARGEQAKAATTRANAYAESQKSLGEYRIKMAEKAQKSFGSNYGALPAMQKNALWYSELKGIPVSESASLFLPGASRNQVTASNGIKALSDVNSLIYKKYGNGLPDPNSTDPSEKADYELYIKNMNQISTTAQEMVDSRKGDATPGANPKPKGGSLGVVIKNGKVLSSTNPAFKVGAEAKNSKGDIIPDGNY
jgi:hypothetical protein